MSLATEPSSATTPKLRLWDTICRSYSSYFYHFTDVLRTSWLWLVVVGSLTSPFTAGTVPRSMPAGFALLIPAVLLLYLIAVAVLRLSLLLPGARGRGWEPDVQTDLESHPWKYLADSLGPGGLHRTADAAGADRLLGGGRIS
jgi:hypothetical protein